MLKKRVFCVYQLHDQQQKMFLNLNFISLSPIEIEREVQYDNYATMAETNNSHLFPVVHMAGHRQISLRKVPTSVQVLLGHVWVVVVHLVVA